MSNPIIKAENLARFYSVGRNKVCALSGVNLEINQGDFVVIFGPSGSGKTTLLSLLAGLDLPSEGQVSIGGTDINKLSPNKRARFRSDNIGMVFQQFNLIPALNSRDNVAIPLLLRGLHSRYSRRQANKVLATLGLSDRTGHKPSELSGGQQQRVAIARALVTKPNILLVDEPTGNLDIPTGNEIMDILKEINTKFGTTIVLVTHNPEFTKYGNRIINVADGKIIQDRIINTGGEQKEDPRSLPVGSGHLSIFEAFRLAMVHFFNKGFRAFLTTLGVAMGVGSVVALVSLGIGLQTITSSQLASLSDLVSITVTANKDSTTKLDDVTASRIKSLHHVAMVSPNLTLPAQISIDDSSSQGIVEAIKPEALDFEGVTLAAGNNFKSGSGVIITKAIAKSFNVSNLDSLIGKDIVLNLVSSDGTDLSQAKIVNLPETISGVSDDEANSNIYLSLSHLKNFISQPNYNAIKVKIDDRTNVETVKNSIDTMGFNTTSVVDLINRVDKVFLITQLTLGIIGGVALLIALIGIVNIMTIALLERTHEVGVLKAVGATALDVRRIFEYEVILYGFFGAIIGVAAAWSFGWGINSLIAFFMQRENIAGNIALFVTPVSFIVLMVVLTMFISLMGGWFPAKKAAKLSAMEALRYE